MVDQWLALILALFLVRVGQGKDGLGYNVLYIYGIGAQ